MYTGTRCPCCNARMEGSDHCPRCGCEEFESYCDMRVARTNVQLLGAIDRVMRSCAPNYQRRDEIVEIVSRHCQARILSTLEARHLNRWRMTQECAEPDLVEPMAKRHGVTAECIGSTSELCIPTFIFRGPYEGLVGIWADEQGWNSGCDLADMEIELDVQV